jgi:hypothetical protein
VWQTTEDEMFCQAKFSTYELWWSSLSLPYVDYPKCNLRNIFESLSEASQAWLSQNAHVLAIIIKEEVQGLTVFCDPDDECNWIWLSRGEVIVCYISTVSPLIFVISSEQEIEKICKSGDVKVINCRSFLACDFAYDYAKKRDVNFCKLPEWLAIHINERRFFSISQLVKSTLYTGQ